jgi:hypothetical protein
MDAVTDVTRLTPIALAVAGMALFIIAAAAGNNALYGTADLLVGAALALFALWPQPAGVRSALAVRGGLTVAAVAAIIDGLLTISHRVGPATTVLTLVLVAGVAVAVLGRGVRA